MKVYLVGIERACDFDTTTMDDCMNIAEDHDDIITLEEYLKMSDKMKSYYVAIVMNN